MAHTSRFGCVSSPLALEALLARTGRPLRICLLVGAAAHLSLMRVGGLEVEQKAAKPLSTQFVKRQPRLTKPLELKKRPQPKRRQIERKMVAVRAKMQREEGGVRVEPTRVLGQIARPSAQVWRTTGFGSVDMEPASLAEALGGSREPEQRIDTALELLDIETLDTGRYHALVVQDPQDKRNVRGFLHLMAAYSNNMQGEYYQEVIQTRLIAALHKLVEALNKYTAIRADLGGRFTFDSEEIFKAPWVMVSTAGTFRMADEEARNFGRYLEAGGLSFLDGNYSGAPAAATIEAKVAKAMLEQSLGAVGLEHARDWEYEMTSGSHPVYHCYFDFDGVPAGTNDTSYYRGLPRTSAYLQAVQLSGRVAALISDKNLRSAWSDWATGWGTPKADNSRQLQFGVNTVIFALTQEGSITRRLMEAVQ